MGSDFGGNVMAITKVDLWAEYVQVKSRADELADIGFNNLSAEQDALFAQLADLLEDYDRQDNDYDAERIHRHRMEVRRFWVERAPIHLIAIFIVVGSTCLALVWAFRPRSAPEDKKWAVSVLSYLLVATAGFAFGKAAK